MRKLCHYIFINTSTHFPFCQTKQTDDCGVFKTTLSNELRICAEIFKLREDDIVRLTVNANRYSFASDLERQLIDDKIRDFQRVSSSPELPGTN